MAKKQAEDLEDFDLPDEDEDEGQEEETEVEEDEDEEDDSDSENEGQDEESEEDDSDEDEDEPAAITFARENLDHENADVAAFAANVVALYDEADSNLLDEEGHLVASDFTCHCGDEHGDEAEE